MNRLNLGAGAGWHKGGWEVIDHSKGHGQAWHLPYPDNHFDLVFMSHVLEHIPGLKVEETLCEINRVMKPGGVLRILTPDLKVIARAYVDGNREMMEKIIAEDGNHLKEHLGLGGIFMHMVVAAGLDNIILSNDFSEIVGSYGHLGFYDREMLENLLTYYGFQVDRKNSTIDQSAIEDHKELRTVPYDNDRVHSLVVECRKWVYKPFVSYYMLMETAPYGYQMLMQKGRVVNWILRVMGIMYWMKVGKEK